MRKFFIRASSVLVQKRRISVQVPWSSASPRDGSSAGELNQKHRPRGVRIKQRHLRAPSASVLLHLSLWQLHPGSLCPGEPCAVCHQQPVPVCVWASPSGRLLCFSLGCGLLQGERSTRGGHFHTVGTAGAFCWLCQAAAQTSPQPAPSPPCPGTPAQGCRKGGTGGSDNCIRFLFPSLL